VSLTKHALETVHLFEEVLQGVYTLSWEEPHFLQEVLDQMQNFQTHEAVLECYLALSLRILFELRKTTFWQ
jgi:hypothetical protein